MWEEWEMGKQGPRELGKQRWVIFKGGETDRLKRKVTWEERI